MNCIAFLDLVNTFNGQTGGKIRVIIPWTSSTKAIDTLDVAQ